MTPKEGKILNFIYVFTLGVKASLELRMIKNGFFTSPKL